MTDEMPTNSFTKSYRFRHVVHAGLLNKQLTLCGRIIVKTSDVEFDVTVDGACKLCINAMRVRERQHPGWE